MVFNEALPSPSAPYSMDLLRGRAPDLILVTSGLSRRHCPAHFLQGGDFTADIPHNQHHPPLCSLGNPLSPTVISFVFVVACLSFARTLSHQSLFVLCGFGKWGERAQGFLEQRMCNVLPGSLPGERMVVGPAPSFNWSHILGLQRADIERECVKERKASECGGGCDNSIQIVLYKKFGWQKETDYQIKQVRNAGKCQNQRCSLQGKEILQNSCCTGTGGFLISCAN